MRSAYVSLVLLLACASACVHERAVVPLAGPVPPELRMASATVRLAGKDLRLSTYLWRDFMPISSPDGNPLIALMRVFTADSTEFPKSVSADRVWVIYGDQAWASTLEESPRQPGTPEIALVARKRPKWGPDVNVDVVVRLRDAQGKDYLLLARDQTIHRTN